MRLKYKIFQHFSTLVNHNLSWNRSPKVQPVRVGVSNSQKLSIECKTLKYQPPELIIIGGLVLLGIAWGLFFSLSRFAGETEIEPVVLVAYIIFAECPFFWLICWKRGRFPRIWRPISMLFYLMAASLGYFLPAVLELLAAPIIGAGLLTIFASMTPLVTVSLAFTMRTEPLDMRKTFGVILGTLALLPIMLREDLIMPKPELAIKGFTCAILVACCYGLYHNLVAKFWPDDEDSWQLATGETVAGAIVFVPFALLIYGVEPIPVSGLNLLLLFSGYMVLSMTSIYLYFFLLKASGPIFVSLAGFISLGAGVVFGMLIFGERHPTWIWPCLLVMLGATWLAASSKKKKV